MKKRKFTAWLLTLAMLITMLPGFTLTASAADNVSYVDAKGVAQTPVAATDITSNTTTWGTSGATTWYYASGNVIINSRVTVRGTVNLILGDGANLTINGGIKVYSGNSIIIWGQSGGTGKLTATGGDRQAGIGGDNTSDAGNITINGGNVTANGGAGKNFSAPAAIGGGRGKNIGTITINGGNVTAIGKEGAGIGNAATSWGGRIVITGGVITTNGLGATNTQQSAGMVNINVSGCPVIYCTGARNTKWGATWTSGILFTDNDTWATGTVFGNPILNQDVSIGALGHEKNVKIPSGSTLTVPEGFTFSTGGGGTVTNEGTIKNSGTFSAARLVNNGNIQNDGNLRMTASWDGDISVNTGTITNGENGIVKSTQKLTGTGKIDTNGIKFTLANLNAAPNTRTLTHNDTDYTTTLSVTDGENYVLPKTITVTVGGTTLAAANYTYDSSTGKLTIPAAQIKGNIEIIAEGVRVYTILFNANGGICATTSAQAIGGKLTSLPEASRTGYRFDGWYDGGQKVDIDTEYTANTTLVAKWIPGTGTAYTVKHLLQNLSDDGYTLHESEPMYGETDSQTSAAAKDYPGFTAQAITQTTITPDGLAVVEIRYDRNTYTVTFNSNGGVGSMEQQEFIYGETIELSANKFTRDGYIFTGWNTEADGSGTAYADQATLTVATSMTLYAQWEEKLPEPLAPPVIPQAYRINIDPTEGGYVTANVNYAYPGETVVLTVVPDNGYKLAYLDVSGARVTGSGDRYTFIMPDGNVTVTAYFERSFAANTYSDVIGGMYYYDAVRWALGEGILMNMTGKFGPDVVCTRAEMVEYIWRAVGCPSPRGTLQFTDVNPNASYAQAVQWAVEQGITTGTTATTFSPNQTVTRAQAMTFLWRYAGQPRLVGGSFSDISADAYYAYAVRWAVQANITTGTTYTTFSPDQGCTRAQIITFLYRWFGR